MTDRYALYIAPRPGTPLARFGAAVLGYDAETGEAVEQLVPASLEPDAFRVLTADPREYGFHATIRAPFRLAEGRAEDELVSALVGFCRTVAPFELPVLRIQPIRRQPGADGFVALVEPAPTPALLDLERRTLDAFQPFRAPLTDAERAKRRPDTLSERQLGHLSLYGYPYVLEEFRFHLSLTGRVPGTELDRIVEALAALHGERVGRRAVAVEDLVLFRQSPGKPFRVLARVPFGLPETQGGAIK